MNAPESNATLRAHRTFRLVLGGSTCLMLGLSWPLWVGTDRFPRVPFLLGMPSWEGGAGRLAFVALLVAVAIGSIGRAWRPAIWASLALLAALILADQHRLQPWAYQYLLTGLAMAALPKARALGLARFFVVFLYLHSGLSKLDLSFCDELGLAFLKTTLRPAGLDPRGWPIGLRRSVVLGMPAWELAVAIGLGFGRTRRVALVGAVLMHLALIAILGPWGLAHSTIVLVWNGALLLEDLILFGAIELHDVEGRPPAMAGVVTWAFLAAAILPFGERWGLWDAWPSFALYASHVERVDVWIHEDDADQIPPEIRSHLGPADRGPWRRLDLTGWSRTVRGVPVYPQARAGLGLALAIAARYQGPNPVGVDLWSRADRWTGHRDRVELQGRSAIERRADRYRVNARPARWPGLARGMRDDRGIDRSGPGQSEPRRENGP